MKSLQVLALKSNKDFMWDFRFSLYWMPTRQALDFDEWLRIPVRNRPLFVQKAKEYLEAVEMISPNENASLVTEKFCVFLDDLNKSGEDVERLLLWFLSISEGRVSLGMKPRACQYWISTLMLWSKEDTFNLRCKLHGIHSEFAHCYKINVFNPISTIFCQQSKAKSWRENSMAYSEFDRFVSNIYYSKLTGGYPARFFYFDIERSLCREWWRSVREMLTEEQVLGLLDELVDTLSGGVDTDLTCWENVIRIDDAFSIDLLPSFDSVARDW